LHEQLIDVDMENETQIGNFSHMI